MSSRPISCIIASLVLSFMSGGIVLAVPITYVATSGSDSNAGTQTAPYATFETAYNHTDPDGTIYVLDPGNKVSTKKVGPFILIQKNITIDGGASPRGGIQGGFNLASGISLTLRNLDISSPDVCVQVGGNDHIVIDNCTFEPGNNDIAIDLPERITGGNLSMRHTTIDGGKRGIWVEPGVPTLVSLTDDSITNSTGAAVFIEGGFADVSDCTLSGSHDGIVADSGGDVTAEGNTITGNSVGVLSNTGSFISISNNTITFNTIGLDLFGSPSGTIASAGNNTVTANGTNGAPNVISPALE